MLAFASAVSPVSPPRPSSVTHADGDAYAPRSFKLIIICQRNGHKCLKLVFSQLFAAKVIPLPFKVNQTITLLYTRLSR